MRTIIGKGKVAAYKRRHAHILCLPTICRGAWGDEGQRYCGCLACWDEDGGEGSAALRGRGILRQRLSGAVQKNRRKPVLDGEGEARLVAVACGSAPEGQARWTLRLLADRLVELEVVERSSRETVSKVLKKMNLSPGRASAGASLPGKARNSSAPWRTC